MITLADIATGESTSLEFKRERPEDSKKFLKTVSAFANGNGGSIIFGIDDDSKIVGLDPETISDEQTAIINTIADSIYPQVVPNVSIQTIDNKAILVVKIYPGNRRPYFIKSMHLEDGTFIRIGNTSRPASYDQIREMISEDDNNGFDQHVINNRVVSTEEIERLLQKIGETADENKDYFDHYSNYPVNLNSLLSWGIIKKQGDNYYATNAFELLSETGLGTKIRCAVFQGKTRSQFLNAQDFDGSIIDQINNAYNYVVSHLNLNFNIEGPYRKSSLEIPPRAIRELIINAVLHRSYISKSDILIAIYDDRLEIISPGGLLRDLDFEKIKNSPGTSQARNQALASVFYRMNLVENWGSGIPRSLEEVKRAGIDDITFIDNSSYVSVVIPRRKIPSSEENPTPERNAEDNRNLEIFTNESLVLDLIKRNPKITQSQLASELKITKRQIQRLIRNLKAEGIIQRIGNNQTGYWKILSNQNGEN